MIKFKQKGDFSGIETYLEKSRKQSRIGEYAELVAEACVDELRNVTPKDSGLTAESWDYKIEINGKKTSIVFINKNIQNGVNVALLLEYGHGTSTGGWVEGQNYISPVIQKHYLNAINTKWKELNKL